MANLPFLKNNILSIGNDSLDINSYIFYKEKIEKEISECSKIPEDIFKKEYLGEFNFNYRDMENIYSSLNKSNYSQMFRTIPLPRENKKLNKKIKSRYEILDI